MKSPKVNNIEKIVLFKSYNFINKHKILNFDCQYFYAQTLAYKELLKLATLSKKQWQSVEPQFSLKKRQYFVFFCLNGFGFIIFESQESEFPIVFNMFVYMFWIAEGFGYMGVCHVLDDTANRRPELACILYKKNQTER